MSRAGRGLPALLARVGAALTASPSGHGLAPALLHPQGRYLATKVRKAKDVSDVRASALDAAMRQIESNFGQGAVMRMGKPSYVCHNGHGRLRGGGGSRRGYAVAGDKAVEPHPIISTGSLALNTALGIGGLPKGRVVEVYGPEASGKTTLALHAVAESQKAGGTCVFVDAEHALDLKYAKALGVNVGELIVSQPDSGEQALEITDTFVRSGSVDVLVIDSVAALVPKAELEGEMGDPHMALQARLMSQALRKISHSLSRSQTLLIFTNQVRSKMGTFGGFGPQEVTSGGKALKYYASVRLDVRRTGSIKLASGEVGGNTVKVKVSKNKLAPPFREVELELEFGRGICRVSEILDLSVLHNLVVKSGSWYSYNGDRVGQGKEKAKAWLRENEAVQQHLFDTLSKLMLKTTLDGCDDAVLPPVGGGEEEEEEDAFDPAEADVEEEEDAFDPAEADVATTPLGGRAVHA